jgi:dihydroceramide fatty acyl 2-hydroxylase
VADLTPQPEQVSPRIFDNRLLERLSRAHPRLPIFLYGPCIFALISYALLNGSILQTTGCLLAGYVLWTLTEYLGHRFVFHLTLPGQLGARLHFLIHGVHHQYPNDPWRLVMPPLMSLPVLGLACTVTWLLFGAERFAPVFAGYLLGYVFYDTLHYELHHGAQSSPVLSWLKRAHMLHHFRDDERAFGISCPWMDYLFGTAIRESAGRS